MRLRKRAVVKASIGIGEVARTPQIGKTESTSTIGLPSSKSSAVIAARGTMIDTRGQASHPRTAVERSHEVATDPTQAAATVKKRCDEDADQSHTTPERAVSTNLRPNSTQDILARENTTTDATNAPLPAVESEIHTSAAQVVTSLIRATTSVVNHMAPHQDRSKNHLLQVLIMVRTRL